MKKIIIPAIVASIVVAFMVGSASSDKKMAAPAEPTVSVPTTTSTVPVPVPTTVPIPAPVVTPKPKPIVSKPTPVVVKPSPVVVIPPVVVPTTQPALVVNTTTTTLPVITTTTTTTWPTTNTTIVYIPRYIACHIDVQTTPTRYDVANFYQQNWPNGFVFPGPMTQQQCQDFGKAWADHMGYRFIPGGTFAYDQVN